VQPWVRKVLLVCIFGGGRRRSPCRDQNTHKKNKKSYILRDGARVASTARADFAWPEQAQLEQLAALGEFSGVHRKRRNDVSEYLEACARAGVALGGRGGGGGTDGKGGEKGGGTGAKQ
jgi:hypothetical protein